VSEELDRAIRWAELRVAFLAKIAQLREGETVEERVRRDAAMAAHETEIDGLRAIPGLRR